MSDLGGIAHMVLLQWRADTPAAELDSLRRHVARFTSDIPGVLDAVVGPSVSPEGLEAGFTWGLAVTFTDAAARDGYLDHPTHVAAATVIGAWAERIAVVDVAR